MQHISGKSESSRFDLTREAQHDGGYDSTNEEDEDSRQRKRARHDLALPAKQDLRKKAKADKEVFREEAGAEEGRKQRLQLLSLSAYDRHKQLVNTYQLYYRGSTSSLQRDTRGDRRDVDIIRQHHKFLWDESDTGDSWEVQLARRYYDKLFKEYCIVDLSRYKENKIGMRWRTEQEVVLARGQFVCGNKACDAVRKLRTWEVNFAYVEAGEKKNALVKVRLCFECSYKLNYHHKRKEVTRKRRKQKERKRKKKKKRRDSDSSSSSSSSGSASEAEAGPSSGAPLERTEAELAAEAKDIWSRAPEREEEKSREEVFAEFLEDLFL